MESKANTANKISELVASELAHNSTQKENYEKPKNGRICNGCTKKPDLAFRFHARRKSIFAS